MPFVKLSVGPSLHAGISQGTSFQSLAQGENTIPMKVEMWSRYIKNPAPIWKVLAQAYGFTKRERKS